MGHWETVADGEPIDINKYVDYRDYATTAERDAASVGWDSNKKGRVCFVIDVGYFYYWNGASWVKYPSSGGSGAPDDVSYVTINAEDELSGETQHANITGANLHVTKAHADEHQSGGGDEVNVQGLSGVLADEQDAGWIKGDAVDKTGLADNDILVYDVATGKWKPETIPGGGDMTKVVYDTDDDGIVDNSEKLEGSTKAQVQTHTPANHITRHISGGEDPFTSAQLIEAIIKRIQESSGPTTLTVGNVSDGQYLKRSASTIIGAAGSAQSYKLSSSYTFYKVGSTYYWMDADGNVDSNADFVTLFEEAINALLATSTGGTITLKAGSYTVNSRIDITSADMDSISIRVTGEGGRATQLVAKNSLNTDMMKVTSVGTDRTFCFQIDHVGFDGNKANNTSGNGIVFVDVMRSHIHDCILDDVKGSAIVLDTANVDSYYNWIDHNQIRNMDLHGVHFLDTGSETTDYHWVDHNTIGRSSVGSTGIGVFIEAGDGVCWITDNAINHMGYSGIRVNTGLHVIRGNGLDRNGRHGINCQSLSNCITDNRFFENSQSANATYHSIYLTDSAARNMIQGNFGWAFNTPKPAYFYYESDSGTNYPNYVVMNRMGGWVTDYKRQQGGSTSEFEHNYTPT